MILLDLAKLFCQNTSIRGVGKIFKAPNYYLRALWLTYFLLMLFTLIFSTTNTVIDYLDYNTVIQTSWALNDSSQFPAITFCSHHPFSGKARTYWKDESIMSPSKWNKILRDRLKICINSKGKFTRSNAGCGIDTFLDDSKRMYYQNLSPNESDAIGHQQNDIIIFCVTNKNSYMLVGNSEQCGIRVQKISIAKYFNCFTVQPAVYGRETKRIILVLNVKEKPNFNKYEQAFVTDIFEQAKGVRMVIHEPDTYPEVEARGDQVEPGKLVDVSYQPIKVFEIKTPKKPCYESPEEHPLIRDLHLSYNYSIGACMSMKKSEAYFKRCKCYYVDYLRPGVPNKTHPYCGETINTSPQDLQNRRQCMKSVYEEMQATQDKIEQEECLRRCAYYRYSLRTSITKWRPTHWQVYWIQKELNALFTLYDEHEPGAQKDQSKIKQAKKDINEYIDSENLTVTKKDQNFLFTSSNADDYVYIMVSRQDSPVMLETNKLTLELNGLISRIGGLCSLYLGLTCAFSVEIIEYIYLIGQRVSGKSNPNEEKESCKEAATEESQNHDRLDCRERLEGDATDWQRSCPTYGANKRGFNDYGYRNVYRHDDESPWSPRVPLNATSL